jgi:hypothetical protein
MLLRTTALLALLFAVGCSKESMMQMVSSPQDQANAQKYIDYLRSGSRRRAMLASQDGQ